MHSIRPWPRYLRRSCTVMTCSSALVDIGTASQYVSPLRRESPARRTVHNLVCRSTREALFRLLGEVEAFS